MDFHFEYSLFKPEICRLFQIYESEKALRYYRLLYKYWHLFKEKEDCDKIEYN
jgi:hypothetical protein